MYNYADRVYDQKERRWYYLVYSECQPGWSMAERSTSKPSFTKSILICIINHEGNVISFNEINGDCQ